jgi:anti-sigma regulatory factor (Ser/Thr protein kinase)
VSQPLDTLVDIRAEADVGAARRCARSLAAGCGATEHAAEQAALAVTELGTNILRHGGGEGHMLLRPLADGRCTGLEVLAVDCGPGMPEVPWAGVRNAGGGLGAGLGGVERLADEFQIHSRRASGTIVLARFRFDPAAGAPGWFRIGGVSVPLYPHRGNGDAWTFVADDRHLTVLVVDGLGHGELAKDAADAALDAFERYQGDSLAWIPRAHEVMRATRGGVLGLARIDRAARLLEFAGVGNISGRVMRGAASRGLISSPGTVGTTVAVPRTRAVEVPWEPGSTLLLWSDGIRSGVDLGEHPGILGRDPSVIAALVHREFRRGNDDATVVVIRDEDGLP